jgi:hypothetical protein
MLQDKAQGYVWNKTEETVYPFIIYFKERISAAVT